MAKAAFYMVLLSVLFGCAFTDVNLDMPISGLETPVTGGNSREIAVVVPFSDERPSPKRCGMKKNGYNMDTADAICATPPGTWLSKLLAGELRASGFSVTERADPLKKNTLVIEGTVSKVFVEPVMGWWSGSLEDDLEINLLATTASGLRAGRKFFSKGIKRGIIIGTLTPYQTSLKRVADDLLEDRVEAVFYLMNAYPQLGVNETSTESVPVFDEPLRP